MATRTVESVGVLSLAKILGAIGLIWGIIVALTWIVAGGPMGGRPGGIELVVAIVGSLLYGVVGGAITALVYNAAAGLVGGLELELE